RARFVRADHSTLEGNLALAAEIKDSVDQVDVLVNNVGGLIPRRETTANGVEMTLALNLRAPVVLTEQLRPVFARDGLVVNVASDAFRRFEGDPFDGLDDADDYEPFKAYARAKLLLVLASLAQARQLEPEGMRVVAVNPGPAWTPGTQVLNPDCLPGPKVMWPIVRLVQRSRSADQAARVLTRVAVASDDVMGAGVTGCYVTARGKVRALGALDGDLERQERAMAAAWSLGHEAEPVHGGCDG
ncbi:MAG TPA: SDR family oxidoreductase, partial [Acidimicrobiales bacterium]|nr:SDR family oxidoreductase [Acidimicrobiales bacterium]